MDKRLPNNNVLLISIDGLRPDAIVKSQHRFLYNFMKNQCSYTFEGKSIMPSITLPCHISMFTSVLPTRHGVTTNIYIPPVHPLDGLCEVLARQGKTCHFYYTWEEMRDIARPGSLVRQELCSYYQFRAAADCEMRDRTIKALKNQDEKPDFIYYYSGNTDEVGHKYGWMSEEYLNAVALASENIQKIFSELPDSYSMVIVSDHGGHDRTHGTDMPEDINIPMVFYGSMWEKGKQLTQAGLLDIAPTITELMGCEGSRDWDGNSLINPLS